MIYFSTHFSRPIGESAMRGESLVNPLRIQNLVAAGEVAIMTWLWSATHQGDLPGFPATGNLITMSGATAYFFDNGRLTGHWQVTDRLGVYLQLRQGLGGA